jgi:hypothetical protein
MSPGMNTKMMARGKALLLAVLGAVAIGAVPARPTAPASPPRAAAASDRAEAMRAARKAFMVGTQCATRPEPTPAPSAGTCAAEAPAELATLAPAIDHGDLAVDATRPF